MNDAASALSALVAVLAPLGVIATGIGVTVTAVLSYRGKRAAEKAAKAAVQSAKIAADAADLADAKLVEMNGKIYALTQQVNGKLSRLLDLTREAALAKGRLEGRAELAEELDAGAEAAKNGGRRDADEPS